ncbi:MAG: hypothetical protein J6T20_01430 [Treponema sp.]|nr:hypothetical protein [Treponema sp.]
MKKKVVFVLLVFFFSFYCHASEAIEIPLIYKKRDSFIMIGETEVSVPQGYSCAFDGKQQKLWFHSAAGNTSTFTQINKNGETEKIITIDYGNHCAWDNGPFFVVDNIAFVCALDKKNAVIFVNLETKEFNFFDLSKYEYYPIYGFYDKRVFFYNNVDDKVRYYDCLTGEVFDAETDLQEYGFMPLVNAYVGLNKKGKIVIQKFDTGEIIETKISGIRGRTSGNVRERYYMTEKYLYFSKKDRWYSFTHGMFFARFVFGLGPVQVAHKWYRYSLETGEIEEIKTDYPFINLLGVVEE